jgi:hypothetical protein
MFMIRIQVSCFVLNILKSEITSELNSCRRVGKRTFGIIKREIERGSRFFKGMCYDFEQLCQARPYFIGNSFEIKVVQRSSSSQHSSSKEIQDSHSLNCSLVESMLYRFSDEHEPISKMIADRRSNKRGAGSGQKAQEGQHSKKKQRV